MVAAMVPAHMNYLSDAANQLSDEAILGFIKKGIRLTQFISTTMVTLQVLIEK